MPRRGLRAALLRAAGARIFHLRFPARIHHRPYAGLSGRPRHDGANRRLDAGDDRHFQHLRIGHVRMARRPHAEALSAFVHLLFPRRGHPGVHLVSDDTVFLHRLRRSDGLDVALDRAPTNGIIAVMFGTRWLGTLAGFAFFSHQVGGFLGVLLGGIVFDRYGSYLPVWWLAILFGCCPRSSTCRSSRSRLSAWPPCRPDGSPHGDLQGDRHR